MYKLIEIKKDILGFHFGEKYIVCVNKENNGKIEIKNYFNETLFLSKQKWVNQFSLVEDILIYSSYDEDFTRIHNLYNSEDIILDVYFYGVQLYSPYIYNCLYYNLSEYDNNFIYDLHTGKVVEKCLNDIKGEIQLNTNNHILTQKDSHIYIKRFLPPLAKRP